MVATNSSNGFDARLSRYLAVVSVTVTIAISFGGIINQVNRDRESIARLDAEQRAAQVSAERRAQRLDAMLERQRILEGRFGLLVQRLIDLEGKMLKVCR